MLEGLQLILALLIAMSVGGGELPDQMGNGPLWLTIGATAGYALFCAFLHRTIEGNGERIGHIANQLLMPARLAVFFFLASMGGLALWLRWIGLPEILLPPALLAYYIVLCMIAWTSAAAMLRRHGEQRLNPFRHAMSRLWIALLPLIPYLILFPALAFISDLSPTFATAFASYWWVQLPTLVLLLMFVGWLVPLLMRLVLPARRMPDGVLRTMLERVSAASGQPVDQIFILRTGQLKLANAFYTGVGRPFRYIFFTDRILQDLGPRELAAVMAHELGHAKHRHIPKMFLFFVAVSLLSIASGILLSTGQVPPQPGLPYVVVVNGPQAYWLPSMDGELRPTFLSLMLALAWFYFAFGWYSRRLERQADQFAARVVGSAAIANALHQLGQQRPESYFRTGWRHFSIAQRIRELQIFDAAVAGNPDGGAYVDAWADEHRRGVRVIWLCIFAALFVATPRTIDEVSAVRSRLPLQVAERLRESGAGYNEWAPLYREGMDKLAEFSDRTEDPRRVGYELQVALIAGLLEVDEHTAMQRVAELRKWVEEKSELKNDREVLEAVALVKIAYFEALHNREEFLSGPTPLGVLIYDLSDQEALDKSRASPELPPHHR